MIMVEGSEQDIINLKFLLLCFEAMSVLGHAEIKQKFPSNVVIPRSSRGRRPRGLPLDAQLRITDEACQVMQCNPLRSDRPGADRTTPLLVATRARRSTGGELLGSVRRQDCCGARVSNTWNDLIRTMINLSGLWCSNIYRELMWALLAWTIH